MGAAIAYFTVLSLAPLLLIVITVAGLVFGEDAARGALLDQLSSLVGPQGAQAIQAILASSADIGEGLIAMTIGVLMLAVGATTVFTELQSDLDRIWRAPKSSRGFMGTLRTRLLSLGLIISVGFLLIVSLVASAAISALSVLWRDWFVGSEPLLQAMNFAVGFVIITALFALVFKVLPSVSIAWADVWFGAAVTSLLFSIGKFLIGIYLGKASIASGFGAAGTLVVLIVWVYYSAQIFLLGAEFTYHFAQVHGSRATERSGLRPAEEH